LTSDDEPEPEDATRDQAHIPSLSQPASLPPSSPEGPEPDDDFDLDELIRLHNERKEREEEAAAAAADPVLQKPAASSAPKESSSERQVEGIIADDEAMWDEMNAEQDAPPPVRPSDNDQEMWDVVDEFEMQGTEGAATTAPTPAALGTRSVYGDDWDDMYAN
jgi:hypothetical protein